jgi:membrane protein YqaA with SNARE-associated domain
LALLSFVAATVVPLGSEWLLAAQLLGAASSSEAVFLVLVATMANTAGGMVTYGLGRAGMAAAKKDPAATHPRLAAWVRRYGVVAGAIGWIPFVGDPVVLLAGIFKVRLVGFLVFSLLGRLGRYVVLWVGLRGLG